MVEGTHITRMKVEMSGEELVECVEIGHAKSKMTELVHRRWTFTRILVSNCEASVFLVD